MMTEMEWRHSVDSRLQAIERRLQTVETGDAVALERYSQTNKRLDAMEDTLKFLVRIIIGVILTAAITFFVQGGFNV